ncbi:RNA repair domain-containing protein [Streptomyces atratus]|uniref:Poly(A) polymerase central domain-containing protein n=1 Tax=Streptomyces atratus TaxID=1893 RepID=A0A1K2AG20_STRAR|nr:RNA repair domain-containing protein [Streptomyces atratus]SFX85264.1 Poly(A) polymerase central domain-containing protein [Streptomyces atratus]
MRTSEEIYHRVRWDTRFDPARFVMGVAQRRTVPKRVPLPRFTPGGDIPWHRVLFFEADGELVWDRSSGVDRIDATEAGRVRAPRRLPSPYFISRTPHAYSAPDVAWKPVPEDAPAPEPIASLTLLTWNTLWDRYDSDRIDTARRRPLLLDALRAADADVIALQETEPALLALLLAAPWVREGYMLWADPAGRDVADYGLLLLSRVPVREAGLHALGPHKAVAAVVVDGPDGPATVAVTHLSSDHAADGALRRDAELADMATGLAAVEGDVTLLGDFNDGGDTPQDRLGMADAWSRVHGADDRTPTFDPSVNPLAAVSSLTGRVSRLDRVLVRSERLRPASAVLLGDVPTSDGLYVSDHFGVRVELAADAVSAALAAEDGTEACAAEEAGAADAVRRLAAALPEGRVHLVGSRRMGCALPGADLDLVAALPGAVDLPGVRERLAAALPDAEELREVTGARVPGLRFALGGLRVDLVTVATGGLAPAEAVARRAELGEAAATALSAVSDADAVLAAADPHRAAFVGLAREVKAWARARGLDSAPCGGLPGLAWSVLAARTAHESGDLPPLPLLRHFFATWATWDWDRAVGSGAAGGTGGSNGTAGLPLTVLTPTAPVRPCTSQVSPAGRDLVAEELFRAWEILESADDSAPVPHALLCAPPPLHAQHTAWALASVRPGPDEGRLRGRLLALAAALAGAGAPDSRIWPRPLTAEGLAGYAIGLGATPPDGHRLAEIGAEILRGIPDATLARVELSALRPTGDPAFALF